MITSPGCRPASAAGEPLFTLNIACTDGELKLPISGDTVEDDLGYLTLRVMVSDGPPMSFDLIY